MIINFTDSNEHTFFIDTNKIQYIEIDDQGFLDINLNTWIIRIDKIDSDRFMNLYKRSIDTQILTEAK